MERISQKALARDRNLRYQTGAALHRDLNRFLNRQYPDFSAQDFSVFIKSVFADEILSLRKRLVEYTKVNLSVDLKIPKSSSSFDDRTSLLDTNTNSLAVSKEDSLVNVTQSRVIGTTASAPQDSTNNTMVSSPSLEVADLSARSRPAISSPTEEETGSGKSNPTGLLDESALAAELNTSRDKAGRLKMTPLEPSVKTVPEPTQTRNINNSESGTSPNELGVAREISLPNIRTNARGRMNEGHRSEYSPRPSDTVQPARFATMFLFSFLCLSIYSILVKTNSAMMCDVIQSTDVVLAPLHRTLGVEACGRGVASPAKLNFHPAAIPPPADGLSRRAMKTPSSLPAILRAQKFGKMA